MQVWVKCDIAGEVLLHTITKRDGNFSHMLPTTLKKPTENLVYQSYIPYNSNTRPLTTFM